MGHSSFYRKMMGESRLTAELRTQARRFFYGVLLLMLVALLLAVWPLPLAWARVIILSICFVLLGLWLRFFYILFFKKDE